MRSIPVVVALATLAGVGLPAVAPAQPAHGPSSAAVERIAIDSVGRPAGTLRDGVLELRLEARAGRWHPEAEGGLGVDVHAFGEVGRPLQIPGPLVRVPAGTVVHATVHNRLDSTLAIHGLGAHAAATAATAGPLGTAGLPRWAGAPQPIRIAPGETRELRFRLDVAGTFAYRGRTSADTTEVAQLGDDAMLTGAIVVDPAGAPRPDDRVMVIGVWERPREATPGRAWGEILTINGKSWPHTARLAYDVGDTVRWRVVNPTPRAHPMHLHGFYFRVDGIGNTIVDSVLAPDRQRRAVTETMRAFSTLALTWVPERPGNWVFHCHFAEHVAHDKVLHAPASDVVAASAVHASHDPTHGADAAASAGAAADGAVSSGTPSTSHAMAGLVVGVTVRERPGALARRAADAGPVRALRLLVQERLASSGTRRLGYVLQRGAEPRRDSIVVPGPPLVLARGQPVRITVVNRLREPTSVHWHGIELESFPDGVPGWSGSPGNLMAAIAPADSFVAAFTPPRAGTFMYHAHVDEGTQIGAGLYAPLIVVEPGRALDPATDHVVLLSQTQPGDRLVPWMINGRETPDTLRLRAGATHRLRLINIRANSLARLRVHGAAPGDTALTTWRPVAKDGADLPAEAAQPRSALVVLGAGEILDVELSPAPGDYRMDVILPLGNRLVKVLPIRVR